MEEADAKNAGHGGVLLRIEDLRLATRRAERLVPLVDSVSLELRRGEVLGLVGESGCGKTLTGLSCLLLFPPGIKLLSGRIYFDSLELTGLSERELRAYRGRRVGMVFQEPLNSLNPVFTVGHQIEEVLRLHRGLSRREAKEEVLRLLSEVKIPDPEVRAKNYPHELSGGMRQRVMIAMALAGNPELLVADEPTTALDVTIQAQILELLLELKRKRGLTVLFISHDLSVVREVADRVAVMYAGELVEVGKMEEVFESPLHPYTKALLKAHPELGKDVLLGIPGSVPEPGRWPEGCRFSPRCGERSRECLEVRPPLKSVGGRWVRCLKREG